MTNERQAVSEIETPKQFCDRVPRELGLVDFNSFEARRHLEVRLAERDAARDEAVSLRANLKGKLELLDEFEVLLEKYFPHARTVADTELARLRAKYSPTSEGKSDG